MRLAVLLTAFALSACAFSSEEPFFADSDAATPFAEGARYLWQAPNDPSYDVTFHRDGVRYTVTEASHQDRPMTGVLFVAIPETPENDYIVQWRQETDVAGRVYAFVWPVGDGFKVYAAPTAFGGEGVGERADDAFCTRGAYGECVFRARSNLLAYYQRIAYPALRSGNVAPESALDVTPITAPPGKN